MVHITHQLNFLTEIGFISYILMVKPDRMNLKLIDPDITFKPNDEMSNQVSGRSAVPFFALITLFFF